MPFFVCYCVFSNFYCPICPHNFMIVWYNFLVSLSKFDGSISAHFPISSFLCTLYVCFLFLSLSYCISFWLLCRLSLSSLLVFFFHRSVALLFVVSMAFSYPICSSAVLMYISFLSSRSCSVSFLPFRRFLFSISFANFQLYCSLDDPSLSLSILDLFCDWLPIFEFTFCRTTRRQ